MITKTKTSKINWLDRRFDPNGNLIGTCNEVTEIKIKFLGVTIKRIVHTFEHIGIVTPIENKQKLGY